MFLFLVTPCLVVAFQPCMEWIPIFKKFSLCFSLWFHLMQLSHSFLISWCFRDRNLWKQCNGFWSEWLRKSITAEPGITYINYEIKLHFWIFFKSTLFETISSWIFFLIKFKTFTELAWKHVIFLHFLPQILSFLFFLI